jgi:hypothetical protein
MSTKKPTAYLDLNWKHDFYQWPLCHPSVPKSTQLKFWATDSESLLKKNKETVGADWMYHHTDITYNFNAHGLRQKKELADIDQDSYIYATGGCIAMGVGINEEDRYADIVANTLGLDLITWGSPLGSLKFQTINFMNMLNIAPKLPKIVIAYHATPATTIFYSENEFLIYTKDIMAADPEKYPHHLEAYKALLNTDYAIQEGHLWRHVMKTTCEKLGIKFIDVSFFADDPYVLESDTLRVDMRKNMDDINYTWARDYKMEALKETPYASHAGVGMHKELGDLILTQL